MKNRSTVGDLRARHIGKLITIPGLHLPGADFDAPRVDVTDEYQGMTASRPYTLWGGAPRVRLYSRWHRWGGSFLVTQECWLATPEEVERMRTEMAERAAR